MTATTYARLAAVVFAIVAVLQFARASLGWPVLIGSVEVPTWASWLAAFAAAALVWLGYFASNGRNT